MSCSVERVDYERALPIQVHYQSPVTRTDIWLRWKTILELVVARQLLCQVIRYTSGTTGVGPVLSARTAPSR
jgi:hypothetical protein